MSAFNDLIMRLLVQDKASPGLKQAQRSVNEFGKAIGGVNKVLGVFGVTLGGAAIVNGIANLTQLGAQAETVGASFDNLARSTGLASDAMLGSLRQASRGAISDMELMQAANKAMIMGGREMGQALPQLLELARAAALATGEDMQFMFNSIVTGIARQSPLILDNLGLIVDMPTAYKAYADSVGVAVTKLTEQQKMTALLNDVLRITPDYLKKVGAEGTTSAEKLAGMAAAIENIKAATGEATVIQLDTALDASGGLQGWADAQNILNQINLAVKSLPTDRAREFRAQIKEITSEFGFGAIKADEYIRRMTELGGAIDATAYALSLASDNSQVLDGIISQLGYDFRQAKVAADAFSQSVSQTKIDTTPWWVLSGVPRPKTAGETERRTRELQEAIDAERTRATEAESAASRAKAAWDSYYSDTQSKAQSALTSRMSPTGLDFLLTGMGQYQNAPLENVRRLDAIIARGFSEIKAHADWASVLKIPPEVLTGSETALKAWAMQTRDAAANLARPDLVDWDAFLKEFDRLTAEEMGRQMTLDLAMGKLASSGRLGQNQDQAKRILQSMLGLDTPEAQALALGEALNKAFTASDPAGIYLNAFKAGTDQNQSKIDEISKRLGSITPDGKKAAEKYLADFNATLAALSVGTTGGGYVLP